MQLRQTACPQVYFWLRASSLRSTAQEYIVYSWEWVPAIIQPILTFHFPESPILKYCLPSSILLIKDILPWCISTRIHMVFLGVDIRDTTTHLDATFSWKCNFEKNACPQVCFWFSVSSLFLLGLKYKLYSWDYIWTTIQLILILTALKNATLKKLPALKYTFDWGLLACVQWD